MQTDFILCFNYDKALDRVKYDILMECLKNTNKNDKDLRIKKNLYWNQKATIRVQNTD